MAFIMVSQQSEWESPFLNIAMNRHFRNTLMLSGLNRRIIEFYIHNEKFDSISKNVLAPYEGLLGAIR